MIIWLQKYWAITRNSFVVFMGDPSILILNLSLITANILLVSLPGFTFGEHLQLIRDETAALAFLAGALAVTIGAAKIISEDLKTGMVPIIMSRPTPPSAFVFGKWTGMVAGLSVLVISSAFGYLWASRIMEFDHEHGTELESLGMTVYIVSVIGILLAMALKHYLFKGAFVWKANVAVTMAFVVCFLLINLIGRNGDSQEYYGSLVHWHGTWAFVFIFLALLTFSAIMTCASIRADLSSLMVIGVSLVFLGLLSRYFVGFIPLEAIQQTVMTIVPDWQLFWISERVGEPDGITLGHSLSCAAQALGQSLIWLIVGSWLFQRLEIHGAI